MILNVKKPFSSSVVLAATFSLLLGCSKNEADSDPSVRIQYALTVSVVGGGSVSPDANGVYDAGASITITAIPDIGYQFDRWEGTDNLNKTCGNASAPHPTPGKCRAAINMYANRNVQAYFKVRSD